MDLEDQSCVNKEVKNFNRKLGKHLKLLECAHYIEINYDRKHHTRHGLHLNAKGKEYVAKQLVSFIKDTSNKSEQTVLPLNWKMTQMKGEMRMCKSKNCISSKEDLEISSLDEGKQQGKIPTMLPTCFRKNQPKDDIQYNTVPQT
jgi:hypothetical protein